MNILTKFQTLKQTKIMKAYIWYIIIGIVAIGGTVLIVRTIRKKNAANAGGINTAGTAGAQAAANSTTSALTSGTTTYAPDSSTVTIPDGHTAVPATVLPSGAVVVPTASIPGAVATASIPGAGGAAIPVTVVATAPIPPPVATPAVITSGGAVIVPTSTGGVLGSSVITTHTTTIPVTSAGGSTRIGSTSGIRLPGSGAASLPPSSTSVNAAHL